MHLLWRGIVFRTGLGAVPPFPGSDAGEEGLLTSPTSWGVEEEWEEQEEELESLA